MQISIDNLEPDEVSKKSLKTLDKRLEMLAEYAEFHVNINSVVGGGIRDPNDALVIGRRALELGFESTIGIIHDGDGQLKPLKPDEARVYHEMTGPEEDELRAVRQVPGGDCRGARRTTGAAGRGRGTCIFARTGWCTTARSRAGIRAFRWPSIRRRT